MRAEFRACLRRRDIAPFKFDNPLHIVYTFNDCRMRLCEEYTEIDG
jgi:hypothetical protein